MARDFVHIALFARFQLPKLAQHEWRGENGNVKGALQQHAFVNGKEIRVTLGRHLLRELIKLLVLAVRQADSMLVNF